MSSIPKAKAHQQDILAKQDLFQLIKSRSMSDEKKIERWKLLGHVIRMENNKSWLYNDTLQMVGEPGGDQRRPGVRP